MAKQLKLINAATHEELKLVKQSGVYKIENDVVVGDLYRDPANPQVAIVDVTSVLHPEDLDALIRQATPSKPAQSPTTV